MKNFIFPIVAVLSFQFTACSPESANREALKPHEATVLPEEKPHPGNQTVEVPESRKVKLPEEKVITLDGGTDMFDFNPQVDILFVIDNSGSMKPAQTNLANSISSFAQAFQQNKLVDYHLGVVTVWDSKESFVNAPNRKYDNGELLPVKDGNGRVTKERFLTRETGTVQALKNTIYVGIAGRATNTPVPEFEEVFSPILGAINLTGRGAPNEGFFRPEAHLVVIIVSDADEKNSRVSPEQVASELLKFKGGNTSKLSVYGVLVRKSDPDEYKDYDLKRHPRYHPECFVDPDAPTPVFTTEKSSKCKEGFGPENFEAFIVAANPDDGTPDDIKSKNIMRLVQKNFGPDLARISSRVVSKTLAKEIKLPERPRQDKDGFPMIRVRYGTEDVLAKGGGQVIPAHDAKKGWTYDSENNSIRLSGDIDYDYKPGARFAVDLSPVQFNTVD